VVHNNFIIGSDAKRKRFREHGMWVVTSGDGLRGWTIETGAVDGKSASSGGSAGRRCVRAVRRHDRSLIRGSNYYERARIEKQSRPRFGKVLWFGQGDGEGYNGGKHRGGKHGGGEHSDSFGTHGGGLYTRLSNGYFQQPRSSFSVELWCTYRGLHERRLQVRTSIELQTLL
jgi:hypothetical protein